MSRLRSVLAQRSAGPQLFLSSTRFSLKHVRVMLDALGALILAGERGPTDFALPFHSLPGCSLIREQLSLHPSI